jgi:2'-5' RNA ligase
MQCARRCPARCRAAWCSRELAGAAGLEPPARPAGAHLTLSRLNPPRPVRGLLAHRVDVEPALVVRAVTLFRSELSRPGPRYTALAEVPLATEAPFAAEAP